MKRYGKLNATVALSLLGLGLMGCSGGGSNGSNDPFAGVDTQVLVQPSAQALVGQQGVLEFEVTNTTASTLTIGAAASSNAVSIVNIQNQIPVSQIYTVTIQDPATVGASAGCWSPSVGEGAILQPNQSCVQFVNFSGIAPDTVVAGDIDVELAAQGQTKQIKIPVNTTFTNTLDPQYAASVDFMGSMVFTPFSPLTLGFNNTSDNKAINGLSIDLSHLFETYPALYEQIDFNTLPQGFSYDATTYTIYLASLAPATTKILTLDLGAAQGILNDPDTVTALSNNSEDEPFIKVSGANLNPVYPTVVVDNQLAKLSADELTIAKNGAFTLSKLESVPDINITTISGLPAGVNYIISNCDTGICSVSLTAAANADPTPSTITITYQVGEIALTTTMVVTVNNTTRLTNNETVVLHRKTETGGERISYITITNSGDFNYVMPNDINDTFTIQSTQSTAGLEIIDSNCAGQTLAPNGTCEIAIRSTSHQTPIGNFTLRTKTHQNLPSGDVAVMSLQPSVDGFDIAVTEPLPNQSNAAKPLYFKTSFTNTGAVNQKIKTITLPDGTNATLTPVAGVNTCTAELALAPNESCVMAYEIQANQANAALIGKFGVVFEEQTDPVHDVTWQSDDIDITFVSNELLPSNAMTLAVAPTFAPNTTLSFTVTNATNQPIQRMTIDFSNMPKTLRDQLDFSSISGGVYDADTQTITYEEGAVLPQDSHTFTVQIRGSAGAASKANYNQLRNNATNGYVKITSLNTQNTNPNLNVNVTPMTFSNNTLSFSDNEPQTITVTNTTNHDFNVGLDEGESDALNVTPTFSDVLPADGTLTITLAPQVDAPLQNNKTLGACRTNQKIIL